MRLLEKSQPYGFKRVLIENAGEFEDFIDEHCKTIVGWKLNDLNYLQLVKYFRLKGYQELPKVYPYIAIVEDDDDHELLVIHHVALSEFVAKDDGKDHLYEFVIRRKDLHSPYTEREIKYQVPAKDIFKAMVELGQTYHKDDQYDLEVVSWKQVR